MQWWDSSALLSLVLVEERSARVEAVLAADDEPAVWWGTKVEATSGICRAQRTGAAVRAPAGPDPHADLDRLLSSALTIPPSEEVRVAACGLLRVRELRAADALQLAAALVWVEYRPDGAGFVCLDHRLREAAALEGFRVLPEQE